MGISEVSRYLSTQDSGVSLCYSGRNIGSPGPSGIIQISSVPLSLSPTKSQPALRKVLMSCISMVVNPTPSPSSTSPATSVSQKEDVIVPEL